MQQVTVALENFKILLFLNSVSLSARIYRRQLHNISVYHLIKHVTFHFIALQK